MSQKIKFVFLAILVLIIINCGTVFANETFSIKNIKQILNYYNEDGYDEELYTDERLAEVVYALNNTETGYILYGQNHLRIGYNFSTEPRIRGPGDYPYIDGDRRSFIEFNEEDGTYKHSTVTYGNLNINAQKYAYFFGNYLNQTNPSNNINYNGWTNNENVLSFYKEPYFEITLDYKGESSIQVNEQKIKAYTYDSISDTGITTIGNKFLKVGYLYIDDNYTISNLLTSVPIMTKYSMNLLNNWEYTLYEGVYTTGEKENGYLKYEIRIPIEYVSTPNYYNIFFRSRDTSIEQDISIDFVLLNNTENSGTIGPIITPSGDVISGDAIKDETTLGDINNTINNLENKLENVILGTENESGDREGGLLGGILDGIKGLFIPSEEAMGEWLTRTQEEVTEKLGILGEPINFFSRLMNKLLVGNKEDFVLHIPELIIPGTEYKLLDAFDINFTQMIEEHSVFKTIYDGYIVIISGIMVYCFYSYLWSFYDHLLGTRDVEAAYKIAEEEVERQQIIQKERKRQPIGFKTKGDNRK